jgi:hypothetical protein
MENVAFIQWIPAADRAAAPIPGIHGRRRRVNRTDCGAAAALLAIASECGH